MDRYVLDSKIGEGSYGVVYKIINGKNSYALKVGKDQNTLRNEICILLMLSHPRIPPLLDYGLSDVSSYIVMPLFRISLSQVLSQNPSYFSPTSVAAIGLTVLRTLRYIHTKEIVFRDLKPENIMLGFDQKIYLVDYGMATHYSHHGVHIKEDKDTTFVGTLRYASLNTHRGWCQSRRDDLESLGYVLIVLLGQSVPWYQTEHNNNKPPANITEKQVAAIKRRTSPGVLCNGLNGAAHWVAYFNHVRSLHFKDAPDYELLEAALTGTGIKEKHPIECTTPRSAKPHSYFDLLMRIFCCSGRKRF